MRIEPVSNIYPLLSEDAKGRLVNILKRSETGNDVDYRSPLYEGKPREEIVEIFKSIGLASTSAMRKLDETEINKIGTYSIRLPFRMISEGLYAYFDNPNPEGDLTSRMYAKNKVMSLLPGRSLRLASLDSAVERMPRGTNLGAPTFSSNADDIAEYIDRARSISSSRDVNPFIVFWRGQPNGTKIPKQRHVCGADHVDTILWERILIPILPVLRKIRGFSAWNKDDEVDKAITELLSYSVSSGRVITSGDHKSFDTHLSKHLINDCFDCIEWWFSIESSKIINILREVFLHSGIICPDGILEGRDGSVLSGAGGTNLIDSLANYGANHYVAHRYGCDLDRIEVMGDDFVSVFSEPIETEDIEELMSEIGLEANKDKQYQSNFECHFLQRLHSTEVTYNGIMRGVRSPFRALNGMMSYETLRKGWSRYMDSVRWIMQAEQVRWDSRFRDFVLLIKEGDEVLSSGMDPVEIVKRAGGSSKIRSVLRITSYPYNTKDPSGINNFATTRVLRTS